MSKYLLKVSIYLKSGQVITIDNFIEFTVSGSKIKWVQNLDRGTSGRLMHLEIDQVAAIVQERIEG